MGHPLLLLTFASWDGALCHAGLECSRVLTPLDLGETLEMVLEWSTPLYELLALTLPYGTDVPLGGSLPPNVWHFRGERSLHLSRMVGGWFVCDHLAHLHMLMLEDVALERHLRVKTLGFWSPSCFD